MFGKAAAEVLGQGVSALAKDISGEKSKIGAVFKKVAGHPIKVLASFLAAPFLVELKGDRFIFCGPQKSPLVPRVAFRVR